MSTLKSFKIKTPLEVTTTTGTAPLSIISTTKVANLNCDLLDGYSADINNTPNTIVVRDGSGNISGNTTSEFVFNFIDASAADTAFVLPDPTTTINTYVVKKIDASNHTINISSAGTGVTIDGSASLLLKFRYNSYSMKSYNGQWYII